MVSLPATVNGIAIPKVNPALIRLCLRLVVKMNLRLKGHQSRKNHLDHVPLMGQPARSCGDAGIVGVTVGKSATVRLTGGVLCFRSKLGCCCWATMNNWWKHP